MKGLELCRGYFEEYGRPLLAQFPDCAPLIAVGLVGSGSECCGYDDEVSQDHDFEPGFCLFLPGEDVIDRKTAFQLERAYAKLPKEYRGYKRAPISPVGGQRHGVIAIGDFFRDKVGAADGVLTVQQWLTTPEYALIEATNGEVWHDPSGTFSAIRSSLTYLPEEIRLKKLAGNLLLMAQSGQYNYTRCLAHGERAAAQLAVVEFCRAAVAVIFLLNRTYLPYYKWQFRTLRGLPRLGELSDALEVLLTTPNNASMAESKQEAMENIAVMVIDELIADSLTEAVCGDLEKHAYSVNDHITDGQLRNLHILAAM